MSHHGNDTLLDVDALKVRFRVPGLCTPLRAVDGVSFQVGAGESVGLVGESGCGKSTIANSILGLVKPNAGRISFKGTEVGTLKRQGMRGFRRQVQMIFQDPFGSLNGRMTIGGCIEEVLKVHGLAKTRIERSLKVCELLKSVGLDPTYADRYPHEFSGGQRQRIGIARALAVGPSLIIADEPVSALDVSVQAQIMNLLKDLQEDMGLAYLFIAHDLAVVRYMCNRVMVMYLGRIVESGRTQDLFARPSHPYTEALLSAVPDIGKGLAARGGKNSRIVLQGDVPSPIAVIPGCPFHPRCHRAQAICRQVEPQVSPLDGDHVSACHFAREISAAAVVTSPAQ
jgi:oligopeptide/dipeptide ABC transporter ATP-binding protein